MRDIYDGKEGVKFSADDIERINSALSAPPRNCDKFNNYGDALEAFEKQLTIEGKLGFAIRLTEVIRRII